MNKRERRLADFRKGFRKHSIMRDLCDPSLSRLLRFCIRNLSFLGENSLRIIKNGANYCYNFGSSTDFLWTGDPSHLASYGAWIKHRLAEFTFYRLSLTNGSPRFFSLDPSGYIFFVRWKLIVKNRWRKKETKEEKLRAILIRNIVKHSRCGFASHVG